MSLSKNENVEGGKEKRRSSVFLKAISLISISIIVTTVVAASFITSELMNKERERILTYGQLMLNLQADNMTAPLWNFEEEVVKEIVSTFDEWPDFQYVSVRNSDGEVIATKGKKVGDPNYFVLEKNLIHIEDGEKNIAGNLYVQLSNETTEKSEQAFIFGAIVVAIGLMVVVLGAVVFILRKITTPLLAMTSTMEELAAGNLAVDIPAMDRHDEVA